MTAKPNTNEVDRVLDECEGFFASVDRGERRSSADYTLCIERLLACVEPCRDEQADRFRATLYQFGTSIDLDVPLIVAALPVGASFWSDMCIGRYHWMQRDSELAAAAFRRAVDGLEHVSEQERKNWTCKVHSDLALLSFQFGDPENAREHIDQATLEGASIGSQLMVKSLRCLFQFADETDVDEARIFSVANELDERVPARLRVMALYQLNYASEHILPPQKRTALARRTFEIANQTGEPWLRYLTSTNFISNLRASGRYRDALDLLIEVTKITDASNGYFSPIWEDSERGFLHMHVGEFDEAQVYLASVVERAAETNDHASFSNLLSIRGAIWLAQGQVDTAHVAIENACEIIGRRSDSGSRLTPAVRAVIEAAIGNQETAQTYLAQVIQTWGTSDDNAARTLAHGLKGAIERRSESIKEARKCSLTVGPQFSAFVDACAWIVQDQRDQESWSKSCDNPRLFGTLIGVAIAGWSRLLISDQSRLVCLESGLYLLDGKVVDLRRRDSLSRIIETLRSAEGQSFDVKGLFAAAWDDNVIPKTMENRVYFAIYELRRLGFRDFLLTNDDGYYWNE